MSQRTQAAGFADACIEKAADKTASAGKNEISVNPVILSKNPLCPLCSLWLTIRFISVNSWPIKHRFGRLLKKVISMALWTKAITCDKAGFKSRFCQEHQAG